MAINPHTLDPQEPRCPKDCPYLGMRTFLPNTLPFYCNQYETFLGADNAQRILRCARCRGIAANVVEEGLAFIDSYMVDHFTIEETKRAFLRLDYGFQKMFVGLVAKTGVQITFTDSESGQTESFEEVILQARQDHKKKVGSPEAQSFKDVLDADGMPLMSRQTKTLLMNLFLVMDNSEKEMMKNILQNRHQVDSFLEVFQKQPQDQDLLKNVRALVYDYERKGREMELTRQRNRERDQQRQQMNLLQLQRKKQRGVIR